MGVSQVIVLDLARVGSGEGVNLTFLKKVIDELDWMFTSAAEFETSTIC